MTNSSLREEDSELEVVTARLRPLVGDLHTGIVMVDADQTVLIANDALISLIGIRAKPADLTGMTARDVIRLRTRPADDYRELDDFCRDCVEHGEAKRGVELSIGPHQTVEVDFVPVRTGDERLGQLWVMRDVTERAEARRARARRDEELSRLAALKTEFLATMSHELRTPLTALTGLAELFAASAAGADATIAEAVRRNVNRMITLVETLLLLAKVESRSLALTVNRVDLDDLLRHRVAAATTTAEPLSVCLRLTPGPTRSTEIDGDEELLGQMMHHALTSVISGSAPGSTVDVLSGTDGRAGRWTAEIINQRPLAGTATMLFTSAPRSADGSPAIGSGLGIALARAISERHGGAVIVKPPEDGDHIVRIELPVGDQDRQRH